jgi:hypothetical protein
MYLERTSHSLISVYLFFLVPFGFFKGETEPILRTPYLSCGLDQQRGKDNGSEKSIKCTHALHNISFWNFLLNARKIICHVYDNFAFELFIFARIKAERKAAASARIPLAPTRKTLKFNYYSKLQQARVFLSELLPKSFAYYDVTHKKYSPSGQ